jgi:hypothetical protein
MIRMSNTRLQAVKEGGLTESGKASFPTAAKLNVPLLSLLRATLTFQTAVEALLSCLQLGYVNLVTCDLRSR